MTNPTQTGFSLAEDGVNPSEVPQRTLYTGAKMPAIGLGTFGSDHASAGLIAEAVLGAASVGYRHFDCASVYGNEAEIGQSFQTLLANGLHREEIWVTSKVWNNNHAPKDLVASCEQSLKDLRLDYLDSYLVHWPFPNYHPPKADVTSRSHDAKPYIHEKYMETWGAMESLVERGLVRHIGTSNMTIPKLKLVLRDAHIKPAVNEMEMHPHFQQPELFNYLIENGISPIGFSPIGSPNRPERDKTPEDTVPTADPVIVRIAERLNVHPAVVCIKWAIQHGQTPIPFSTNRRNYLANLRGAVSEPLTGQDMSDIAALDKNNRFIKGQVFLWKDNQDWEDLWDVNGEITPA
ncbi:MAG: aldehyde oxidoreductase [Chloroflexi bacterium 54-19]|nr:MAG: aldehyde oxidoreductase [Chloroflexi bacterium 54-19]